MSRRLWLHSVFLRGELPRQFKRRSVVIAPCSEQEYRAPDWADAIVFVETGDIELEWLRGGRYRFSKGDVTCLARMSLRRLRNVGRDDVKLVVISRREAAELSGWP